MTHNLDEPSHPLLSKADWERAGLRDFASIAKSTYLPLIFTDGRGCDQPISFVNDAFLMLTCNNRASVLNTPLGEVLRGLVDPTSLAVIKSATREGNHGKWEMLCRRADGSNFMASVFLSSAHFEAGEANLHAIAFVELGGNVEQQLSQRDAMNALYALAPGFIATSTGAAHRFTFANASFKRFVAREHLEGLTVEESLPEIVDQGFLKVLDDVYRSGEPFVGRGIPMDIRVPETGMIANRYCDFVYQAVRDPNGTITGLFCEGYDVTEQRETAEKLSVLQAEMIHVSRVNAMGTMAATLAHEINHPLAAITNYASGILRLADAASPIPPDLVFAIRGIEEAAQRAGDIIRNLREMVQRRVPDRVPFELRDAVSEAIRLVRATVPPSIVIMQDIPDDTVMAADRVQIQQVLINLLRNACDAVMAATVKQVVVSAKIAEGQTVVCICDTGPGVPIEVAERLFSWAESSKENGMGLGLSISRTIVEVHRGRIWLENSSSAGSELCFSIPL